MMARRAVRNAWLASTVLAGLCCAGGTAHAQDASARIGAIEAQIKALQDQLRAVKRDLGQRDVQLKAAQRDAGAAQRDAAAARAEARRAPLPQPLPPPAAAPAATAAANGEQPVTFTGKLGQIRVGGITIQAGGFLEAAGIYRSNNEVADLASNWNGIPFPNVQQQHESETRFSARQSRFSLLVEGKPDPAQTIAAYGEADFLGAAPTANSTESNSYNPRLRQAFASYDNTNLNLHVLGGQAWSLLTLNKAGIVPRQEVLPQVIDAQYVPGFTWKRQPQVRVATDFDDHRVWLAASLENPQTNFYNGPNGAGTFRGTTNSTNPGGSNFAPNVNYSLDAAPDVVLKAAWDPGFGHYEVYGLARFFRSRVSTLGRGGNDTTLAGGGGAAMILPVVHKYLDFQASFLGGTGIGSYGAGQLPDATLTQSGAPAPVPEVQALVGLIGHPRPDLDIYGYVGTEQASRRAFTSGGRGFGYGSPLYSNAGCNIELSTQPCVGNTSGLVQGAAGFWWRFLHGNYGTAQVGATYSYTDRTIFSGVGGGGTTGENTAMLSLRYYPFQ